LPRLAQPQAPAKPLAGLGVVWSQSGGELVPINGATLEVAPGPTLKLGFVDGWAAAPDRGLVAFAVHALPQAVDYDALRFVDPATLRPDGEDVQLDGSVRALAWLRPDRVLVVLGRCCVPGTWIAVVDTAARRVVDESRLEATLWSLGRSPDALVLLVSRAGAIAPARVVVVDAGGRTTTIPLRIVAGTVFPRSSTAAPIGRQRVPGLAVDPAVGRAYVIAADREVAEVDLDAHTVAYHRIVAARSLLDRLDRWLQPAAEAKGLNGSALSARWLGDGLIAVGGSDETASVDRRGTFHVRWHPRGVAIVDTRDWTVRMLDPAADALTTADGLLLATGSSWSSGAARPTGPGLTAYGPDWTRRFTVLDGRATWISAVTDAYAFVGVGGEQTTNVVELASGRVVATRPHAPPLPLLLAWPLGS
jgi:hypothetical protein